MSQRSKKEKQKRRIEEQIQKAESQTGHASHIPVELLQALTQEPSPTKPPEAPPKGRWLVLSCSETFQRQGLPQHQRPRERLGHEWAPILLSNVGTKATPHKDSDSSAQHEKAMAKTATDFKKKQAKEAEKQERVKLWKEVPLPCTVLYTFVARRYHQRTRQKTSRPNPAIYSARAGCNADPRS
jgi:hypothetical protein